MQVTVREQRKTTPSFLIASHQYRYRVRNLFWCQVCSGWNSPEYSTCYEAQCVRVSLDRAIFEGDLDVFSDKPDYKVISCLMLLLLVRPKAKAFLGNK